MSAFHLLFKNEDSFNEFSIYNEEGKLSYLPSCQAINIFIGSNNSGKSRFLRKIIANKEFIFVNSEKMGQYEDLVIDYNNGLNPQYGDYRIQLLPMKFSAIKIINSGNKVSIDTTRHSSKYLHQQELSEININFITENKSKRYYIPTLRTAHSLFSGSNKIEDDIYSETLSVNHGIDKKDITIFTGLHLYKQILKSRNSDKATRENFDLFEKFLSDCFFDGKRVDVVANFDLDLRSAGKSESELILIHVEGEKDTRKLFDLGDGVQAIIILMYQIFMAESNSMIFIDEPELHLHPGMQRLFLEQLCNNPNLKAKGLTYFITTHSNHFLDLTIEKDNVSIYSFSSQLQENGEKRFFIKNVNAGDNEVLKNLGVNNSSVFMANCGIWVEGISDRNYIKAFLKAYIEYLRKGEELEFRSIKEDIDYAFFEYAGSNIEHYFFGDLEAEEENEIITGINAMALNNRILLLADSDNAEEGDAKRRRFDKLKKEKKDNFVPIIIEEIREIENLLTNEIWKDILINFCNKRLVSNNKSEIVSNIDSALKNINALDYETEYIGKFLNAVNLKVKKIGDINIINESIYERKPKIGTFVLKRELSELVLKADFPWAVFEKNPRIVQLTKSIYNFITKTM